MKVAIIISILLVALLMGCSCTESLYQTENPCPEDGQIVNVEGLVSAISGTTIFIGNDTYNCWKSINLIIGRVYSLQLKLRCAFANRFAASYYGYTDLYCLGCNWDVINATLLK